MIRFLGVFSICIFVLLGCSDERLTEAPPQKATKSGPKLCAALRGNGHYLITHFASLARIVEHYGPVNGIAGSSSSTITMFLYQNMHRSPSIRKCGERPCRNKEMAERLALLLKSIQGYAEAVATSPEGFAVQEFLKVAQSLKEKVAKQGILALIDRDTERPLPKAKKDTKQSRNLKSHQP